MVAYLLGFHCQPYTKFTATTHNRGPAAWYIRHPSWQCRMVSYEHFCQKDLPTIFKQRHSKD